VVDHGARIGRETRHGAANVRVDLHDLFYRARLDEGRGDAFFNGEDDSVGSGDADCCGAELYVSTVEAADVFESES
jgi:hypothetical protein